MASTATDSFLQLTTPLSSTFIVTDFAGTEALSELFTYIPSMRIVTIPVLLLNADGIYIQAANLQTDNRQTL